MLPATSKSDRASLVSPSEVILITGASGFIGLKLVETLAKHGFKSLRCFVRPSGDLGPLERLMNNYSDVSFELHKGNLLSREDCIKCISGTSIIFHLAAGRGEKSYADAFLNSVVTTRNLLEAARLSSGLKRFVNVSSLSVYSTRRLQQGTVLDESCDFETDPLTREDPYCYAKVRQDELVVEYANNYGIPFVIARPGVVYGPGKRAIHGRIGIDTFGIFLHLGGGNRIPLTYVENCADAIMLSGITPGVEGEIFNIIDDDCPSSRSFLKMYKKRVGYFPSLYIPYWLFYWMCFAWEKYSAWSEGQLPPVFNRRKCETFWKRVRYSNDKIKSRLNWSQTVSQSEAFRQYFDYQGSLGGGHD